ncbi:MAG: pyridine nucleotide-disulfide oxidoreductase, partial [Gammaproteobacteria bacterium]|nr:pyridine nucleotide-disulfide oxidoreductase [Gammaproteobacteria bacterium]
MGSLSADDNPQLGIAGFRFADLYAADGLKRLHQAFVARLDGQNDDLAGRYRKYLEDDGEAMDPVAISELLVSLAPILGDFVAELFAVSAEHRLQREAIEREVEEVFVFRNEIIASLRKHFKGVDFSEWDSAAIGATLAGLIDIGFEATDDDPERRVAAAAAKLHHWSQALAGNASPECLARIAEMRRRLQASAIESLVEASRIESDSDFVEALLEHVRRWAWLARNDAAFAPDTAGWLSFKEPARTDFAALVPHATETRDGYSVWKGEAAHRRRRDGFALTDGRYSRREILYEIDHCIYCHDRDTDSC